MLVVFLLCMYRPFPNPIWIEEQDSFRIQKEKLRRLSREKCSKNSRNIKVVSRAQVFYIIKLGLFIIQPVILQN